MQRDLRPVTVLEHPSEAGQPEGGEAQSIRALYAYLKKRFGRA